jgi:dienelactone hydrolase
MTNAAKSLRAATQVVQAIILMMCGSSVGALCAGPQETGGQGDAPARLPNRPLFLDTFRAQDQPVISTPVEWASAIGRQQGRFVRPQGDERLPGLLVIGNGKADAFLLQSARELAGIGYAVLLVPLDRRPTDDMLDATRPIQDERRELALAKLRSAVRWLRGRRDVFPDKLGILAWGATAPRVLEAAADQHLQATIVVDGYPSTIDASLSLGLKHTAVLIVRGTRQLTNAKREERSHLERNLASAGVEHRVLELSDAKPGFMENSRGNASDAKAADRAWFEIYEFFGKHVEDAELNSSPAVARSSITAKSDPPRVAIDDVMRAINGSAGIRSDVARALGEAPRDEKEWKLLRARAAVMTDSGATLMGLKPQKGTAASWRRHATAYRDAAAALVDAADRRKLTDARSAFDRLNASCARCHAEHR